MIFNDDISQFLGRETELEIFKRRVLGLKEGYRQNIAIVGSAFIGKSFALQFFLNTLDDNDIVPVFLDFEQKDFAYVFPKFVGSLLYNYSKSCQLPLHEDLNLLLESVQKRIPMTADVIRKLDEDFQKGKYLECFQGLMLLPEIFNNESGKFSVLVMDEFQNIEDLFGETVFQDIGKKIMTQKKCLYVLVSSYPVSAKRILSEKLSLLFGNFEVIQMEAFDAKTSQKFIDRQMGNKKIGAQLRNFLSDFTGGHPLYLSLLCQEMNALSAMHNQDEIYMPIVTQAIENTIFSRWGVISRHFELIVHELCSAKGTRTMMTVLIALSKGHHRAEDIFKISPVAKVHIRQRLLHLLDLCIIEKNGQLYYLKDKMFKYWIKFVYQRRLKNLEFDADKVKRQFKEELLLNVEHFKVTSRQDFSSRIVDLLHAFSNESLDLNGRTYKLPSFRSIEPSKLKDDTGLLLDVIKAQTQDAHWYIILKKENVQENDVNLLMEEISRQGKRPERCLIISLSDLEDHVRLKALQEKFWIWNEGELNTLLTLFNKSYIVR